MNKVNKDIKPLNNNYQRHGYCEIYYDDGSIYYKGYYHNGKEVGYFEVYHGEASIKKLFFII